MYPDYPDPMPVFQYMGGDHGRGLLESALAQPRQMFGGRYLYRTMPDKAAALLISMIKNHPFVDGNKRVALTTTAVFFIMNRFLFFAPRDEAVRQCLSIAATHGNVDHKDVARWMRRHSVDIRGLPSLAEELTRWLQRPAPRDITEWLNWYDSALSQSHNLLIRLSRLMYDAGVLTDEQSEAFRKHIERSVG